MRIGGNRRRVVAVLLGLAVLGAACGDDDDSGGSSSATTGGSAGSGAPTTAAADVCTPDKKGGTITVGTGSPFTGMDPNIVLGSGSVGGDYMSAFYDTLMRYDAKTQQFKPHVAESLTGNATSTQWTLKLKPNIKFGNGDTMTTEDVKAHVERLQKSRVRAAGMAQFVKSMTITDPQTMVFELLDSWGTFPYMLATEPGWVPNRKLVTERADKFHVNPNGAGVGPYEVQRIAEGEEIVLTAKANYWGGTVCVDTLRFRNVPGADAAYDAFTKKELDTLFINQVRQAAKARDAKLLPFEAPVGGLGYVLADQGITGGGRTAFNDVRVREAMQLAINYELINSRLFDNKPPASDSAIVPKTSAIYHGVAGPPFDQNKARQLVQQTTTDGTWNGSFTFLHATTPEGSEQAVLLKGMWEAVGMKVTLEAVPAAALSTRVILERKFQVSTNGFAVMDPAPWTTLNGLESKSTRQRTGFADSAMDAALAKLRAATTIDETKKALGEMQTVWNRTFPLAIVSHAVWGIAAQEHIRGLSFGPDNTLYFNTAYVKK